jgi:hypothetical protein
VPRNCSSSATVPTLRWSLLNALNVRELAKERDENDGRAQRPNIALTHSVHRA